MNTGLPDGGKRVYKSNGAFRGSSGKLDPRDVLERPGTRPWPTRTDIGLYVIEVRTGWVSALGRSLSLCGKHPDSTIIHASGDLEKRQCQKILDHFCWSHRKTGEHSCWAKESQPLWSVPKEYNRLGENSLLLGAYHIRAQRKWPLKVVPWEPTWLHSYLLNVCYRRDFVWCCWGYSDEAWHLS